MAKVPIQHHPKMVKVCVCPVKMVKLCVCVCLYPIKDIFSPTPSEILNFSSFEGPTGTLPNKVMMVVFHLF